MKIAIFHNLPSGGAKRTLVEFTRRLSGKHHLSVYTLSSANHEFGDIRPWVNEHHVYEFNPSRLLKSPFGRFNQLIRAGDLQRLRTLYRKIAQTIDANQFDLVFVEPCQFENSPSVLRYLRRTPSVFYCHEPLRLLYEAMPPRPYNRQDASYRQWIDKIDPFLRYYRWLLRKTDQENIRKANLVLVNSENIRKAVKAIYQVDAQINYLGVDAEFFRPLGLSKEKFVISVGSLTPLKGFDFILRALGLIPASERPGLWIASNFENSPERGYLQDLAQNLGIDLHLKNGIPDQTLVELYNRASATVYAPVREPFGLVALESMACGTPVIGVREGGLVESVIDQVTGMLVEREESLFSRAIQEVTANLDLANNYGRQGRDLVLKQWTWENATQHLEDHFQTCLQAA